MRKIILLSVFLLLAIFAFSDEYVIFTGTGFVYNDLLKTSTDTTFAFKFDDEQKVFYLVTADFLITGWIILTPDDLTKLRPNLDKYMEWERTAVVKGVEIEKELPNSTIATRVIWKYGDDWHNSNDIQLSFTFFSQNKSRHQLVIGSNKVTSPKNEYITYKLDQLYLDKDQVQAFSKGISAQQIEIATKDHEQKKTNEDLFQ